MNTKMTPTTNTTTDLLPALSADAVALASQLMEHLAPLFPNVASMARDESGAAGWVASWSRQIEAENIGPRLLAATIRRLGELDPNQPLSWPRFAELARQCRFTEPNLREDPEWRERRMREFRAKYPGAQFTNL